LPLLLQRGGHSESKSGCGATRTGPGIHRGSARIPEAKSKPLRLTAPPPPPLCGLYARQPITEPALNAIPYGTYSGGGAGRETGRNVRSRGSNDRKQTYTRSGRSSSSSAAEALDFRATAAGAAFVFLDLDFFAGSYLGSFWAARRAETRARAA